MPKNQLLLNTLQDLPYHFDYSGPQKEALLALMTANLAESASNFRQMVVQHRDTLGLSEAFLEDVDVDSDEFLHPFGEGAQQDANNLRALQRLAAEKYILFSLINAPKDVFRAIAEFEEVDALRRYLAEHEELFGPLSQTYHWEGLVDDLPTLTDDALRRIQQEANCYPRELDYFAAVRLLQHVAELNDSKSEITHKTNELIAQVHQLFENDELSLSEALDVIQNTRRLLVGEVTVEEYKQSAQTMEGKPSLGLKILGGIMMALGVAIAAVSAALIPATASTSVFGVASGALISGLGYTLFDAGRSYGVHKTMSQLSNEYDHEQTVKL